MTGTIDFVLIMPVTFVRDFPAIRKAPDPERTPQLQNPPCLI